MKTNIVYIGLGSNIEQPYVQVKNAIIALDNLSGAQVIADSGYFKSGPMGPADQPDYVNAVVKLETTLSAKDLLKHCQLIEKQQGRIKKRHWGERTIDLDILLYAHRQIDQPDLIIPHPGICQRDFVYMPLLKIDPKIEIPGIGLLSIIVKLMQEQAESVSTDFNCAFAGDIE